MKVSYVLAATSRPEAHLVAETPAGPKIVGTISLEVRYPYTSCIVVDGGEEDRLKALAALVAKAAARALAKADPRETNLLAL